MPMAEMEFPKTVNKQQLGERIWKRIHRNRESVLPSVQKTFWRSASWLTAACILLAAGWMTYHYQDVDNNRFVVLTNLTKTSGKPYNAGGIRFNLGSHSCAKLNLTNFGEVNAINFAGVVEFSNITDADLQIALSCSDKNNVVKKFKINCMAGRTYLLVPDKTVNKNFTIIDKKHVTLLPTPLLEKVQNEFLFI